MGKSMDILILDDEPIVGKRLLPALKKDGHQVEIFVDPKKAVSRLEEKNFDIVVTDIRMDELDGIQVLETVTSRSPRTKVIMITGYATLELARESLTKGAFEFIAKPFRLGEIRGTILKAAQALEKERLKVSSQKG
ncbi:MAG: response regulator [Deltaproteobacteria bacterium HGW-Deltaproteobacteria-21]|nr:MAG: response regulator [Deltaproteobacteria bacterium HGW-Deltaproteobacteria-21]